MATCNYISQENFDLYTNLFEYEMHDGYTCFDDDLFEDAQDFLSAYNKELNFFEIKLKAGYYEGIQTYITSDAFGELSYEFDAIDFLNYYDDYDGRDIYAYLGYNKHILKLKILAEIKKINDDILPQLIDCYNFDRLRVVGRFSNGEAVYEKI